MSLPGKLNIVTLQGDYFERQFLIEEEVDGELTPIDFTEHNVIGQVRTHSSSPTISALFNIDWINRSEGEFLASLTSNVTSKLPKNCVYDIQSMDPLGRVRTWVYGSFRVLRETSRG